VLFPVAAPSAVACVAAPPALTTQPEYVYLLRVVDRLKLTQPNAKIPTVLLPAADPRAEAPVAAVAELTASLENVYLLRVVERVPHALIAPKAKIAKPEFPATGHSPCFAQ
jgi:hypothetical protein